MPNRIIREGILTSERVNALSPNAELFYRRLQSVVDDFGRYTANPTLLRASCYPLKLDSVKEDSISKHLAECVGARLIVLYTVADKAFLELQDFRQQVRAKDSKYPSPDGHLRSKCVADAQQVIADAHLDGDGDGDGDEKSVGASGVPPAAPVRRHKAIPAQAIVDGFNTTLTQLAKVRSITPKRQRAIERLWRDSPLAGDLDLFRAYWEECEADPFLSGRGPYRNGHENWRPDFDYLLRPEVVTKAYEKAMDAADRETRQ